MKVLSNEQLDAFAESHYKAGIERCLRELTSRQLVVLDQRTGKGQTSSIKIDMQNPALVHNLINRLACKEEYKQYVEDDFPKAANN